ncbi:hypothetical protein BKA80DRAFT_279077 [Phyllosticta citrichinensis]
MHSVSIKLQRCGPYTFPRPATTVPRFDVPIRFLEARTCLRMLLRTLALGSSYVCSLSRLSKRTNASRLSTTLLFLNPRRCNQRRGEWSGGHRSAAGPDGKGLDLSATGRRSLDGSSRAAILSAAGRSGISGLLVEVVERPRAWLSRYMAFSDEYFRTRTSGWSWPKPQS